MHGVFLLLIFLVSSTFAEACRVKTLSTSERVEESKAVYVGRISSVYVPAIESMESKNNGLGRVNREVRVFVHKTLIGVPEATLNFELHWCDGNAWSAKLGEKVAAYLSLGGHWYVESGELAIENAVEAASLGKP